MSILTQCPLCGFTHLRAPAQAGETVTCNRCKRVFVLGPATLNSHALSALASAQSSDLPNDSEPVYEVDFIEVLDDAPPAPAPPLPPAPSPPSPPAAEQEAASPFAAAALGPWELEPSPAPQVSPAQLFDEVEIIAPPPLPVVRRGPVVDQAEVVENSIPSALPIAEPVIDQVEVVDEATSEK
jgi:hypothetical protein